MLPAEGKINVCAYCRVSTDKTDQLNSLENQVRYFTEYVRAHSEWRLTEVYFDEGISGTSVSRRNGFNRMIVDAENGAVQLIITKEVSRFARNTVDALSYTRRLKEKGVGVLFMTDNIDTRDCDGELRLTIMASIAQEESRKTSERVKWGQRRRMEQGAVFGSAPYGFENGTQKLTVNEREAEVVRKVFEMYANESKSAYMIAAALDSAHIRPRRAPHWTCASITKLLRNEKYVGDICQGKTSTPDFLTHKKISADIAATVYIKNHHAPIISRELWEKAQARLNAAEKPQKQSVRYWCSGKIYCGKCGAKYVSRVIGGYTAWRCGCGAKHGGRGCVNPSVNMKILCTAMLFLLKSLVGYDYGFASAAAELIGVNNEVKDTEQKILRLEKRLKNAVELALDGYIDKEKLDVIRAECQNRLQQLKQHSGGAVNTEALAERVYAVMLNFPDEIFRSITEKITVYEHGTLGITLDGVGEEITLEWSARGKGDGYTVNCDFARFC